MPPPSWEENPVFGMQLIKILDSDTVHTVTQQSTIPRELFLGKFKVLKNFKDVFEGIGELSGEYTMHTNNDILPVVHPLHRLPISLHGSVKQELDAMVAANIIAPVSEPTRRVSSMVVVKKKNNKIKFAWARVI